MATSRGRGGGRRGVPRSSVPVANPPDKSMHRAISSPLCTAPSTHQCRTLTYDLETHYIPSDQLAHGDRQVAIGVSPILMASAFCSSCKLSIVICNMGAGTGPSARAFDPEHGPLTVTDHVLGSLTPTIKLASSSTEVADALMSIIVEHKAAKVGGFNSIGFDNQFLFTHSSDRFSRYFTRMPGGYRIDTNRSCSYDLYLYASKFHVGEFTRYNLDTVSTTIRGKTKLDAPTGWFGITSMDQYESIQTAREVAAYCLLDSVACGESYSVRYDKESDLMASQLGIPPSMICGCVAQPHPPAQAQPCRFGWGCTRPGCWYAHEGGRQVDGSAQPAGWAPPRRQKPPAGAPPPPANPKQELQQRVCGAFGWSCQLARDAASGRWAAEVAVGVGDGAVRRFEAAEASEATKQGDREGSTAVAALALAGLQPDIDAELAKPVKGMAEAFGPLFEGVRVVDGARGWAEFWALAPAAVGIDVEGNKQAVPMLVQVAAGALVVLEAPSQRQGLSADMRRLLCDERILKVFCDGTTGADKRSLGLPVEGGPGIVDLEDVAAALAGPTGVKRGLGRIAVMACPELGVRVVTQTAEQRFNNVSLFAQIEQGLRPQLSGLHEVPAAVQRYAAMDAFVTLRAWEGLQRAASRAGREAALAAVLASEPTTGHRQSAAATAQPQPPPESEPEPAPGSQPFRAQCGAPGGAYAGARN